MKTTIIILLILAATIVAQTTYEVAPGTKENKVILSIANESKTLALENVKVTIVSNPKGIEMYNSSVVIDGLKGGEEKETAFTFDAKRIPGAKKDTLRFDITDKKGGMWKKEIVIEYSLPKDFKLEQNYPNPFNPTTTVEFTIPQKGRYNLSVYNILGQLARTLSEGEFEQGYYKTEFDARQLASGIYIYRLNGNNVNISKKMILLK